LRPAALPPDVSLLLTLATVAIAAGLGAGLIAVGRRCAFPSLGR